MVNISHGKLVGTGQICFYSLEQIDAVLQKHWLFLKKQHYRLDDRIDGSVDAEWRVIVQKNEVIFRRGDHLKKLDLGSEI